MNTHDHDNEPLPGEDELKALYRSLPRKEPSPALDNAVKRAAAHAVRASQRRPFTRWPVAVASAAMVVVAAGLGWRMMRPLREAGLSVAIARRTRIRDDDLPGFTAGRDLRKECWVAATGGYKI